jgi:methionine synthase I (cobalamin-dependent)
MKKILEENVSFSAFAKRKQRFIVAHQPQAIKDVHAAYFDAGADIVETNTTQEPPSVWLITILKNV